MISAKIGPWRKSSRSTQQSACVELAIGESATYIRDMAGKPRTSTSGR
ncbi:DUF397 domain-containing protein [Saccharopolyspora sp. NPDC002686]